jgi:hypothetical protein
MEAEARLIRLVAVFALGTWILGWFAVPMLAMLWVIIEWPRRRLAIEAGLAAAAGWGALLVVTSTRAPLTEFSQRVAAVTGIRTQLLFAVTLVFPALLAWSAARVAEAVATRHERAPGAEPVAAGTADV